MNDFSNGVSGMGAIVFIAMIICGIPVFFGLLFKVFVSFWGL
jgi:hypothetical protein